MRRWHTTVLILAGLTIGCGGPKPPPTGLHGGRIEPLPDQLGSVEFLKEAAPDSPNQWRFVVYFLDPSNRPITPEPTGATLKLGAGPNDKLIELKPADGSDTEKAGALIGSSVPNSTPLFGELAAKISDRPVSVMIRAR